MVSSISGQEPLVSVCVLCWNGRQHLADLLPALADQEGTAFDWQVLVLDNGSTDGTTEWLQENWSSRRGLGGEGRGRLEWHRSERNLGFCGGNNELVRRARGELLVLLNDDTRPEPEWLATLVESLRAAPEDVAAVGGMLVDWSGERSDFVEGLLTFDGHAFQRDYGRPLSEVRIPEPGSEQLFGCGGNMIVRRSSFERVGGFDDGYFAYLEDVDLGWRLWSAGERVLFEPRARAAHRSMASSGQLGVFRRGLLFERNALRTAYKNFDEASWRSLSPAILMTFVNRAQSMLVENHSGGALLTVDPYAGSAPESGVNHAAASSPPPPEPTLTEKWRAWGTLDLARRGLRKSFERAADALRRPGDPGTAEPGGPVASASVDRTEKMILDDPRAIAQFRAYHHFRQHLRDAEQLRRQIHERRRRPDREIFERFGLYVVPTYPGDRELFEDPGFATWLPSEPPLRHRTLDEIQHMTDGA